jgi:hypothetical protein
MSFDDLANLDPEIRAALEREVAAHDSLADAIRWARADALVGVVAQDEYTHDVLLRWRDGYTVAYDST